MAKQHNKEDRGAGSGVIRAGSKPMERGVWDVYETTNPYIGLFDRCFWLEVRASKDYLDKKQREAALSELAAFFVDNIKDNIIFLDFSSKRIMGGVSINAGTSYFNQKNRSARSKRKDRFPDEFHTQGYELRMSEKDAVTFLTLWKGYEFQR